MADKRECHIFRVIGQSEKGPEPGTYLDLLRADVYELVEGAGQEYKKTKVRLKWYLDDAGKVPNPARETKKVRIVLADEEDPEHPKLWFEVDIVEKIKIVDNDQVIWLSFDNSADNRGRKVKVRRTVHQDTTIDDDPTYDEGGVIPFDQYQKIKDTKDEDTYIDHEIITKRPFLDFDQIYAIAYNNQPLIDATEEPDTSYGEGQINPPWRLDPLQTIINCSGGFTVEFLDKAK